MNKETKVPWSRSASESSGNWSGVRKKRASYQRKIIGTAVVFFIILIIVCALLPGEDNTASEKWEKPVNDRQTKVLQSLQDNFK